MPRGTLQVPALAPAGASASLHATLTTADERNLSAPVEAAVAIGPRSCTRTAPLLI